MIKRFASRLKVEAIRFEGTEESAQEIVDWVVGEGGEVHITHSVYSYRDGDQLGLNLLANAEDYQSVHKGDWVYRDERDMLLFDTADEEWLMNEFEEVTEKKEEQDGTGLQ